ncbi:MAG: polymer-forming cytoskeletal protein [Tenuifilum sp.]|uniref:bactofilin family protein n=1 Tax=Tenuifilum sp. TaxID=2760880 RepID=UPI001B3FD86F|nr:polymer-forming cytoskeletal protein [Bacteroidales bacterium]HOU73479.1 polymer-forming cytoskeletal protein [Tenuifilum sp.]MBP9028195.1 polymer-forming cytoskeletal protein [Bacteroidales bacterium]HQE53797.1 polymer-forming cytoskeletal protein [Tenuifilum sp.]HQG71715.1 polymer-forming cytoskeletal protein [Tenuifilum sp.]
MAKINEPEFNANNINLVGFGTEINGDIKSSGDLRIDGILVGNLNVKGKVVVGETGKIKGELVCKNSDISGVVEGKITVDELLSLKSSARINGDITVGKLAIEPGCKFTGYCNMLGMESKEVIPGQE